MLRSSTILALALLATACHSGHKADVPGDSSDHRPYQGIAQNEALHFTGTEPFWGGQASGGTLTYTTPDKPDGSTIPVTRFAGRNGVSFSGTLGGRSFDMMVTPADCGDGMSDRRYTFAVMLSLGSEVRQGCGWTDAHPFREQKRP